MTRNQWLLISGCFFLGSFLFALHKQWVIINLPFWQKHLQPEAQHTTKKACTFFYYASNKWHKEVVPLLWSTSGVENATLLVTQWLAILKDEKILKKPVALELATLNGKHTELLLSFDAPLFAKEHSTVEKLMIVESLLKTVAANEIKVIGVRLMMHHQPLQDYHLDFTRSWPISGYASLY